ncbi:hypothetical protein ACO0QE_004651 [Hanseniaspora vineae]
MKILKTDWIGHFEQHTRKAVYTVDICNDNEHVATGGIDGVVKIWSLSSMLACCEKSEKTSNSKALATMNRHSGAVTVVKFSPDGKYLATGSDDRIILIWEKEGRSQAAQYMAMSANNSGDSNSTGMGVNAFAADHNEEHWVVRRRLAAHDNDIQDMCWSPDSSLLVSVGLDRSIIVWNGATFERVTKFDVHHSLVKGVIFDPANKYFATASDDRTVKIFRYHRVNGELNFSIEANVSDPFKGSPITTYFRRLSWSPDGQHIAAPNATNGPVSSVAIINRGSWDSAISLIGHTSPSEVARFNPRLFRKVLPDREIEIEVSEYEDEDEIGDKDNDADADETKLSEMEKNDYTKELRELKNEKHPGKRKHKIKKTVKKKKVISGEERIDTILCSAGQDKTLTMWSTTQERPIFIAYDIVSKSVTDACWNKYGNVLIITSLDGSILPIIFSDTELGHAIPLEKNVEYLHRYGVGKEVETFPESVEQVLFEERAQKEREKNKKSYKNYAIDAKTANSILVSTPNKSTAFDTAKSANAEVKVNILIPKRKSDVLKQAVVQKDGKKRVAPTLVSSSTAESTSSVGGNSLKTTLPIKAGNQSKVLKKKLKKKINQFDLKNKLSTQSYPIPRLGVHTLIMGIKDRSPVLDADLDESQLDGSNVAKNHSARNKTTFERLTMNAKTTPARVLSADINSRYIEYSSVLPDVDCALAEATDGLDDIYVLEIRNGVERSIQFDKEALYENPTKLLGYHKGERSLCEIIPEAVNCVAGSVKNGVWAISTTEGSLYLFSSAGRFKVPKISLGYKMVQMKFFDHFLVAVTETGLFFVIDVANFKMVLSKISISPLIFDEDAINSSNTNKARVNKKLFDFTFKDKLLVVEVIDTSNLHQRQSSTSNLSLPSDFSLSTFKWNAEMGVWMSCEQ